MATGLQKFPCPIGIYYLNSLCKIQLLSIDPHCPLKTYIYLFKSPNWYLYTKIAVISALPWSSFLPLNIDHTVLKYQFCINDRIVFSHLPLYKLQDFTTASITMPAHQLIKTSALSFKNWNCFERARRISLVHLEFVFCANRNCSIVSFKRLASRFLYFFLQNNQFRFAAVLINS